MAPLKKERAQAVMEETCRNTDNDLRFCSPCIPHAVTVMVMAFAFHNEDPDGVGVTINIFLFPDHCPSTGS